VVPGDAYTRDRVGFDAFRVDDEERSLKGGRRPGVGAGDGEGVGFGGTGAIAVGLYLSMCYVERVILVMTTRMIIDV